VLHSSLNILIMLVGGPLRHSFIRHASERTESLNTGGSLRSSRSQEEAREHQRRRRLARLKDKEAELERIMSLLTHPGGPDAHRQVREVFGDEAGSPQQGSCVIDWGSLPMSGRVSCEGIGSSPKARLRIERKQAQVESFLLSIQSILRAGKEAGLRVVEYGCGSGNLLLPLACQFPQITFHGVDHKADAIGLLRARAEEAGISDRVTASIERIEDHHGSFDLALILHVCGSGTDAAIQRAREEGAAFLCSPCCIGKIKVGSLPSSQWMRGCLGSVESSHQAFRALASAADISSHMEGDADRVKHSYPELASLGKINLELDRIMAVSEQGEYNTLITRILKPHLLPTKTELLIGVPKNDERFKWPF
jgi:2-polyprenyl-3-methyl-5-hydroxy-6-metoxy-1,4-benzoquinol methylase